MTPEARAVFASSLECQAAADPHAFWQGPLTDSMRMWSEFSSGELVVMSNRHCLMYGRVWKSGNDNIRQSVMSTPGLLLKTSKSTWISPQESSWNEADFRKMANETTTSFQQMTQMKKSHECNDSVVFTFVREPLGHFLSGRNVVSFCAERTRWDFLTLEKYPPQWKNKGTCTCTCTW